MNQNSKWIIYPCFLLLIFMLLNLNFWAYAEQPSATDSDKIEEELPLFNGAWLSPGFSLAARNGNPSIGGELSIAFTGPNLFYAGLYGDIFQDAGLNSQRFSIGPEMGTLILGIDGGYCGARESSGNIVHGWCIRPYILLPFVTIPVIYYRYSRLLTSEKPETWHEFGFSFKIPLSLKKMF